MDIIINDAVVADEDKDRTVNTTGEMYSSPATINNETEETE